MWRSWSDCNKPDAMNVKNHILDPTTESSFQVVLTIMAPLYSVLQLTDREGSTIGLLYEFMRRSKDVLAKGVEENIQVSFIFILICYGFLKLNLQLFVHILRLIRFVIPF